MIQVDSEKFEMAYLNLRRIEALADVLWQAALFKDDDLPPETLSTVAHLIQDLANEARTSLEREQPEEAPLPVELQ
jgi:hypothetical protein